MKLTFIACIAVVISTISLPAAPTQPVRPKSASNPVAVAKSKVPTNAPVVAVTNAVPALTNAQPKIAQIPDLRYTNGIGMQLVKTPGGFLAGVYEVTQKQYQEIMGSNPSTFSGDERPVDNLSWNDAVEF